MTVLDRKLITRMVNPQPGGNGGGGGYVPQSQAVSWTDINGKPTTLSGYGITDAYWATTQSTSDKRNLTIGSVTQQVITAHQSLSGYATEYWVGQQGYITSSGSCAYATSAGNADTVDDYHASGLWRSDGGTWNPQANIEMHANANGCEWSFDMHRGNYTGCIWHVWDEANGSILVVDGATARVGIGTTSPSYKLHVVGRIYCTGGFAFLSDIRKKDVIAKDLHISVGDIAKAPLIRYTLKSDEKKEIHIGSVAQYWQNVMPETINESNDGTLSMDYGTISLVSVVTLARKLETLEKELSDIKKKLITK